MMEMLGPFELGKVHCVDALEALPLLPEGCVNLVVTSPPYNIGNAVKGSFYGGKGKGLKIEYLSHNDAMLGDDYRLWQRELLIACYRTLKNNGAIFYNHKPRIVKGVFDDRTNLIPLPIRQQIIWDRCGMVNFSGSFFASSTERIFIIAKPPWRPVKECVGWGEVWKIPPEINTPHPAPFPLSLALRLVTGGSNLNDIILDPFMGSGTTGVAAAQLGRRFLGFEINQEYCDIANKRIQAAERGVTVTELEAGQGTLFSPQAER
jgi:modification methylase